MKKLILILLLAYTLAGCHKKKADLNQTPLQAKLIFPELNAICTQGTIISPTQSTVIFKWNTAENADNYDVVYKNLLTGNETTQNTTGNQLAITLLSNTPYSWYVRSKSTTINTTSKSDVWKFYNSGQAVTNYAPFPADLISPAMAEQVSAGKITFKWTGTDADNDPLTYDIYCGTTNTPTLLKAGLATSAYAEFSADAGTTYFWKIISKDSHNNTSDSGIYQFTAR